MTDVVSVVTYLERCHATAPPVADGVEQRAPFALRCEPRVTAPALAAELYGRVGAPWHWTDRLQWTPAEWQYAIDRTEVELWIARIDGAIAGYFQLQIEDDAVELKYFGLVPEYIGRRLGRRLLAAAIARAQVLRPGRMTVNTCTLDHPAALPTYLDHGFAIVRTETRHQALSA